MSRQLNFYLTESDHAALLGRIEHAGPLRMIKDSSADGKPVVISVAEYQTVEPRLWRIYLVRPCDLNTVFYREVPKIHKLFVDTLRSPVIEFDRCRHHERGLNRGRFYVPTSYYDDAGGLVRRQDDFLRWVSRLFRQAKKTLTREDFTYVGRNALEMRENNGLQFMLFTNVVDPQYRSTRSL